MLNIIEMLRAKLNEMVAVDEAILFSGEILKLSQELDKLIFVEQAIRVKRTELNYEKQLRDILHPDLYAKLVA